jgi:drug/metabolite transporter (DMT)-like permease
MGRGALRPLRGHLPAVLLLACVQITVPFVLIGFGEQHISSSFTSLIIAAEPLLVALFALRLDAGERVSGPRLAGLLIGLAGVAVLFGLDLGGDRLRLLGAGLVLLATACYAIAALLLRRRPYAALPGLGLVAVECTLAGLTLLPLALTRLPGRVPDASVLASLLVLGLVCTAGAFLLFFALIAEAGAGRGIVFTYVNPVVAVCLGAVVLGERIDAGTLAGFLLILAGSWLSVGGGVPARLAAARNRPWRPRLGGRSDRCGA